MKIDLPSGTYVLAISGGVDSMVLLNLAIKLKNKNEKYKFILAHLDHGIRIDSKIDRKLVQKTAQNNNLEFVFSEARLGPKTSEAKARELRYEFLEKVKKDYSADAIVTAHHQDDQIETAILNMLRGTGRKGLSSLTSRKNVMRPLLIYSKKEILKYAKTNKIIWHEDSTNSDEAYLRNYIRLQIIPKLSYSARTQLLNIIIDMSAINSQLDEIIADTLKQQPNINEIERFWFNSLAHNVAKEVMASWLRVNKISNFTASTLNRLVVQAKTGKNGQQFPIINGNILIIKQKHLALSQLER